MSEVDASSPKEVAYAALEEIYSEAEPPLDFDALVEDPDDFSDDWYDNHELSSERQREILDKHLDCADLTEREETSVVFTVITDLGPRTPMGDE